MKIKDLFKKFKHRFWSTSETLLLKHPANKPIADSYRKKCIGEFREVTEQNIYDCANFENAEHYVPIYRKMLEHGDHVHYGYLNDICVFRTAAQVGGSIYFDGENAIQLSNNDIYIHYVFCAPSARGLGFHSESMYIITDKFGSSNKYACVDKDNAASLNGFFRTGYELCCRLVSKNRFFIKKVKQIPLSAEEKEGIINSCHK